MIKIRDNIDLNVLEEFGFKNHNGIWAYLRRLGGMTAYSVYVTKKHRYLQIYCSSGCKIASRLQTLIYDLTVAGIIEKEED